MSLRGGSGRTSLRVCAIALSSILSENPSACDSPVNPQPLNWYNLLLSNMELLSQSSQTHFLDLRKK